MRNRFDARRSTRLASRAGVLAGVVGLAGLVGCDSETAPRARRIEPSSVPASSANEATDGGATEFSTAPKRIATH